jgi:hypothetical protein
MRRRVDAARKPIRQLNSCMRFFEFKPIKHIKPLTLPQARIHNLKANIDSSKRALKAEKDLQQRQAEAERQRKKRLGR